MSTRTRDDMTGEELALLLDRRGWSAAHFGEHIGITKRQVNRWIADRAGAIPRYAMLLARQLPQRATEEAVA